MAQSITCFQGVSANAIKSLSRHIETVYLPIGNLSEFDHRGLSLYIYFPTTAICAVNAVFERDDPVQLIIFGSNTIVGSAIESSRSRPTGLRTSVVIPGFAGRISTDVFNDIRDRHPDIDLRLLNLSMRFTWEMAAELACTRFHSLETRIAEKIARIDALLGGSSFAATAATIAEWAECSRSTAHATLSKLKAKGAIDTSDNQIVVCNRSILNTQACGCSRQKMETVNSQLSLPMGEHDNVIPFRH